MDKIKFKKIVIISIYSGLIVLIIWMIYAKFRPAPSCSDNVKNQNEEGVDCGGICPTVCGVVAQDIQVGQLGAVPSGISGKYDFYAQLNNPNATFGNKNFYYTVDFKNAAGAIIASRRGSSFIIPGERKYIIENNMDSPEVPTSFSFEITGSDWMEFNDYYERPDIQVVNKNYDEISGGVGFSEATGLLKNKSSYDFDLVKVEIILKDSAGKVLALNSTQMNTIASGEQRDFSVNWPNRFPGAVGNMETQVEVNIFNSDNFLKRFYKAEKFQQY